jgi:hypothetical protein
MPADAAYNKAIALNKTRLIQPRFRNDGDLSRDILVFMINFLFFNLIGMLRAVPH